jgi:hypothetical protein
MLTTSDAPLLPAIPVAIRPADRNLPSPAASAAQLAVAANKLFQIPLPERFRGCWQGVPVLDSQQHLSRQLPAVKWSPENYRLCFVGRGSGTWQVLYGETHVDSKDGDRVEKEQAVEFFRFEGVAAVLRTSLVLPSRPDGKNPPHEATTLLCEIADTPGALMRVNGNAVADVNGEPWRTVRWHASLAHVGEPTKRATENVAKPK